MTVHRLTVEDFLGFHPARSKDTCGEEQRHDTCKVGQIFHRLIYIGAVPQALLTCWKAHDDDWSLLNLVGTVVFCTRIVNMRRMSLNIPYIEMKLSWSSNVNSTQTNKDFSIVSIPIYGFLRDCPIYYTTLPLSFSTFGARHPPRLSPSD